MTCYGSMSNAPLMAADAAKTSSPITLRNEDMLFP